MRTHVNINGREIHNSAAKLVWALVPMLITAVMTALVLFVLLPLIGVAFSVSAGVFAIFCIAVTAGIAAFILGTHVLDGLFGSTELHVTKRRNRK